MRIWVEAFEGQYRAVRQNDDGTYDELKRGTQEETQAAAAQAQTAPTAVTDADKTAGDKAAGGDGGSIDDMLKKAIADGSLERWNPQLVTLLMAQMSQQAQMAANAEKMRLIDLPMLEEKKKELILQAARDAANAEYQRVTSGLGILNLTAGLRGPKDAFVQQNVLHGINSMGLSNAVDAVAGRISMPATQAPQATPEPVTMANFLTSVLGGTGAVPTAVSAQATPATQAVAAQPTQVTAPAAAGFQQATAPVTGAPLATTGPPPVTSYGHVIQEPFGPVQQATAPVTGQMGTGVQTPTQASSMPGYGLKPMYSMPSGPGGTYTGTGDPNQIAARQATPMPGYTVAAPAATISKSAADYGKALPVPNKIVPEQWERLDQQTKDFLLGAYEAQGYAQEDILNYVQKAKPQFKTSAPSFGQIRG